jgi:hypothetical protein
MMIKRAGRCGHTAGPGVPLITEARLQSTTVVTYPPARSTDPTGSSSNSSNPGHAADCGDHMAGRVLARRRLPVGITMLHELVAEYLDPAAEPDQVLIGIETERGPWVQTLLAAGFVGHRSPKPSARSGSCWPDSLATAALVMHCFCRPSPHSTLPPAPAPSTTNSAPAAPLITMPSEPSQTGSSASSTAACEATPSTTNTTPGTPNQTKSARRA